jgi:hypothetical protein
MSTRQMKAARVGAGGLVLATLGGCTNGINAGVDGGIAFIAMAGMLILMCLILWFILGRDED